VGERKRERTNSIKGMESTRRGERIKEQRKEEKWGVRARKSSHITVGLLKKKCKRESLSNIADIIIK